MSTAGLNVKRLTGLLQRLKVDCELIEGDEAQDHCVLLISSVKCPGLVAQLTYENQGDEPRLATIKIDPSSVPKAGQSFYISEETIRLRGPRAGDVDKIVQLVERDFLKLA